MRRVEATERKYTSGPHNAIAIYCSQYIVLLLLTIAIYFMLKYRLIYKEALSFIIVLLKNGMNKMRTVVEFISLEQ